MTCARSGQVVGARRRNRIIGIGHRFDLGLRDCTEDLVWVLLQRAPGPGLFTCMQVSRFVFLFMQCTHRAAHGKRDHEDGAQKGLLIG